MKTREEIITTLEACKPEIKRRFKVHSIAIFGSYVRGEQQAGSDVDILVDVDPSIGLEFVTLAERLQELLDMPVDLVSRRAIKSRNWSYIESDIVYV